MTRSTMVCAVTAAVLAASMAGIVRAQENLPVAVEALRGHHWHGGECCGWTWDWVQQSGPSFSGTFRNPNGQQLQEPSIIISIVGNQVQITRAGGSAAGGCTYTGTIRVGSAEGSYACAGKPAGPWAATIYQTAPSR